VKLIHKVFASATCHATYPIGEINDAAITLAHGRKIITQNSLSFSIYVHASSPVFRILTS